MSGRLTEFGIRRFVDWQINKAQRRRRVVRDTGGQITSPSDEGKFQSNECKSDDVTDAKARRLDKKGIMNENLMMLANVLNGR